MLFSALLRSLGGPLDLEGAQGLVLGAMCPLQGTFNPGCLREGEQDPVRGESLVQP